MTKARRFEQCGLEELLCCVGSFGHLLALLFPILCGTPPSPQCPGRGPSHGLAPAFVSARGPAGQSDTLWDGHVMWAERFLLQLLSEELEGLW